MQPASLSRREREIMDILYALGSATAAQVQEKMPGDLSYSTVRAQLRVLEEKGHVSHIEAGTRYVYRPSVAREKARRSALRHLTETFFEGSTWNVVTALLGGSEGKLKKDELDRLAEMIERARKEQAK
jgi:predicted transcriptional regulator